jgi:hypothetical protein
MIARIAPSVSQRALEPAERWLSLGDAAEVVLIEVEGRAACDPARFLGVTVQ